MRVAVIYNEPKPSAPDEHWLSRSAPGGTELGGEFRDESEYGVLDEIRTVAAAIGQAGHEVQMFGAYDPAELAGFLARERPEVVFNCCESFRGRAALEMNVAALYELF